MASKHLPRRAKTKGGLEKCLANPGSRQKITKTTHAVRGLQTKWEIQDNKPKLRINVVIRYKLKNQLTRLGKIGMWSPYASKIFNPKLKPIINAQNKQVMK